MELDLDLDMECQNNETQRYATPILRLCLSASAFT